MKWHCTRKKGTDLKLLTDVVLVLFPQLHTRGTHWKVWPFHSTDVKPLNPKALNPFEKFKCLYWFGSGRTLLSLASSVYLLHWESRSETAHWLQQRLHSRLTIILGGFSLCGTGKIRKCHSEIGLMFIFKTITVWQEIQQTFNLVL